MAQMIINGYNVSSGYIVDEELNTTSVNPVQNKVLTKSLNNIVESISNPNLLDNPDFKINQRGQAEYTQESSYNFFVDRWSFHYSVGVVFNTETKTLTIPQSDNKYYGIIQRVEENLAGKTVTLSAKIETDVDIYARIVYTIDTKEYSFVQLIPAGYNGIAKLTVTIPDTATTNNVQFTTYNYATAGGQCKIEWAKLELGSVATPFTPPDPTLELIKCGTPDDTTEYGYMPTGIPSNPNLLINPDFRINQRGQTEYEANGYSVDMWLKGGGEKLTVTEDGVTVECTAEIERVFKQTVEIPEYMVGTPMTLSVNVKELSGRVCIFVNDTITDITSTGVSVYHFIPTTTTLQIQPILPAKVGAYAKVSWAKLEFGSIATPFVPPTYTEELLKIQSMNDDGTSKLVSNSTLPTVMNSQMVSNPNLLVNSDFSINQRGQTEYNTAYGIDCWLLCAYDNASLGSYNAETKTLTLGEGGTWLGLAQTLANYKELTGKTVTISASASGDTWHIGAWVRSKTTVATKRRIAVSSITDDIYGTCTFIVPEVAEDEVVDIVIQTYGTTTLNYIKAELGSIATSYTSPNPAEELLKVQSVSQTIIGQMTSILTSDTTCPNIMNSAMVSNPNLLDNPDFKINQRGNSEYTGTASYCIDRWWRSEALAVVVGDEYLTIKRNIVGGYPQVFQTVETPPTEGDIYTASLKYRTSKGIFRWCLSYLDKDMNEVGGSRTDILITDGEWHNTSVSVTAPANTAYIKAWLHDLGGDASTLEDSIDLAFAKLELGSVATAFVPPNPAEELFKIQSMNDDGTPKLVSNDTLPSIMNSQMVSNPNLLDNPNFKINQRGQSEYTTAGYTVDRWKLYTSSSSEDFAVNVSVDDNGITVSTMNGNAYLMHDSEHYILGSELTLSVCDADGNIYSGTCTLPEELPTTSTGYLTLKNKDNVRIADVSLTAAGLLRTQIAAINTTHKVKWMKLEYGSVATSFIPPDPITELLKCQRYFIKIKSAKLNYSPNFGTGYIVKNGAYIVVPLPTTMRQITSVPTITIDGTAHIGSANSAGVNTIINAGDITGTVVLSNTTIAFVVSLSDNNFATGSACIMIIRNGGISISAEL